MVMQDVLIGLDEENHDAADDDMITGALDDMIRTT